MKITHKILTSFLVITFAVSVFAPPFAQKAEANFWDDVKDVGYAGFKAGLLLDYCTDGKVGDALGGAAKGLLKGADNLLGDTEFVQGLKDSAGKIKNTIGDIADSGVGQFFGPIATGLIGGLLGGGDVQPVEDPATKALAKKEQCYDALAQNLARGVLKTMSDATLDWVQEGLNGNPLFVQDWLTYKLYQTDEKARRWLLNNDTFQDICGVFKSDIALALQNHYYSTYTTPTGDINGIPVRERGLVEKIATTNSQYKCGLERALEDNRGNLARFVEGSFYYGGWQGWDALQSDINANPYASYLQKTGELQAQIRFAEEQAQIDIETGEGFLPERKCVAPAIIKQVSTDIAVENGFQVGTYYWEHPQNGTILRLAHNNNGELYLGAPNEELETAPCFGEKVVTPAVIVNRMIQDIATGDVRRTELADEMNDVMNDIDRLLFGGIIRKSLFEVQPEDYEVQYETEANPNVAADGLINMARDRIDRYETYREYYRQITSLNGNIFLSDLSNALGDASWSNFPDFPRDGFNFQEVYNAANSCAADNSDVQSLKNGVDDLREEAKNRIDESEEPYNSLVEFFDRVTAAELDVRGEVTAGQTSLWRNQLNAIPYITEEDVNEAQGDISSFFERIVNLYTGVASIDECGIESAGEKPTILDFEISLQYQQPLPANTFFTVSVDVAGANACSLVDLKNPSETLGPPVSFSETVQSQQQTMSVPEGLPDSTTLRLQCVGEGGVSIEDITVTVSDQ